MAPADGTGPSGAGGAVPASPRMAVEVVFSPAPRQVRRWALQLPQGATAAEALQACEGLGEVLRLHHGHGLALGIWGRKAEREAVLRDGDRLEVYRPLIVDPKEARRQRYRKQGEKLPKGIHRSTRRPLDMTSLPGQDDD